MLQPHEIGDITDRVRYWLQETNEELNDPHVISAAEQLARNDTRSADDVDSVGLLQLVESLTAMRHDHKLHAKSLRQLYADVQSSLTGMNLATQGLENARSDAERNVEQSAADATESLLIALLDVDEAVRQAITSHENASTAAATSDWLADVERIFDQLPGWKKFFVRNVWDRIHERLKKVASPANANQETSGTLEGLRMLHARVQRVLAEAGVVPVVCVGKHVDPRTMCVVDVVEDATLPPETVVDELRGGYVWHNKTIRVAEVRTTKSQVPQN